MDPESVPPANGSRRPAWRARGGAQGEGQIDTVGEVGGGHISVEGRDNTTRSEERASTFIVHSGEVSDDACRKRPTPSERKITTTPAQAIPSSQEESESKIPCTL